MSESNIVRFFAAGADNAPLDKELAAGLLSDRDLDRVGGGAGADLGSWSKADGLDVTWSSTALSTVPSGQRLDGS